MSGNSYCIRSIVVLGACRTNHAAVLWRELAQWKAAPAVGATMEFCLDGDQPMATVQKTTASSKTQPPAWNGAVPAAATAVVKRIEGFFSAPYDDNGALPGGTWTIGYGSIVDANGHPVSPATPPITEAEAEQWLRRDMEGAARDVKLRVKVALLECEAAALISWTYNLC
ncbi:MAG: glycoside hydrolase family protein [Rhodoferax sp.]|nr:glycoside hydrolase family protein [Rhodoferax sp.]